MQVKRFTYHEDGGWSLPALPRLDSTRTLVMVYGAKGFSTNQAPLKELHAAYPSSQIIGCSTSGEISGLDVSDESLSVAVTRFDKTELRTVAVRNEKAEHSFESGRQVAQELSASPGLRSIFILSEGLSVNGSELIRGMNDVLDASVVVTGGLAGDGDRFESTWVMWGHNLATGMIAAVGFYGDHIAISHGSKGGWDTFGPERKVTRAKANVLYELDGKPALALYKTYLGERASGLPGTGLLFPLSLRESSDSDKHLVRTLLAVDEAAQSMTFAGDIPQGWSAQLMKADFDRLVTGAENAAKMTDETGQRAGDEHLAVAISCVGRRLVLGKRTEDEIEVVMDVLPKNTELVGFYSYGELSPFATGKCDLHNQTMTLTVFSESSTPLERAVHSEVLAPPAARAAEEPIRVLPTPPAPRVAMEEVTISEETYAGTKVISLAGTLSERFPKDDLARRMSGTVALDLKGVIRINSFGVRAWLDILSMSAGTLDKLYLLRCSSAVLIQIGMIRGFVGSARILSFEAPYLCEFCEHSFDVLFDLDRDRQAIQESCPRPVSCPRCTKQATFEDEPSHYMAFMKEHLGNLSPAETALLRHQADPLRV